MMKHKIVCIDDFSIDELINHSTQQVLERVNKFSSTKRKKQCLIGYKCACDLLNEITGLETVKICFRYGIKDKPYFDNSNYYFNFAHSSNLVICAISDREIGTDIEKIQVRDLKITNKVCSEQEKKYIGENYNRFFEVWTAKEAFQKLTGQGISDNLKAVEVANENGLLTEVNEKRLISGQFQNYCFAIAY